MSQAKSQALIIQQAKQGDLRAISLLLNQVMQPRGVLAHIERGVEGLHVFLWFDRPQDPEKLGSLVQRGFLRLALPDIQKIRVELYHVQDSTPVWSRDIVLQSEVLQPENASETQPEPEVESPSPASDSSSSELEVHLNELVSEALSTPGLSSPEPQPSFPRMKKERRAVREIRRVQRLKELIAGALAVLVGSLIAILAIVWLDHNTSPELQPTPEVRSSSFILLIYAVRSASRNADSATDLSLESRSRY